MAYALSDGEGSERPLNLDLLDSATWQDMHATRRRLREHHPLAFVPLLPAWLVLRYDDVARLLSDPRLAGGYAGVGSGAIDEILGGLLANQAGEKHARLRHLLVRALTPRQIDRARGAVRAQIARLLAAQQPGAVHDFQQDMADALTRHTLGAVLGIPARDSEPFAERIGAMLGGAIPIASAEQRAAGERAAHELLAYLHELAERRRRAPEDALLDALLAAEHAGDRLSANDLERVVMSLLFGGTDTVRSFLGIATWLALSHPGTLAWLRDDPERAASAVEEMLRFEPPAAIAPRIASASIEIGGVEIPAGARVMLDLIGANRDPRRFADPDRFDPSRAANAHLALGRGAHFCVGAALARMQAQELLLALANEPLRFTLVETPSWVPFSPSRRLAALRLRAG